MEKLDLARSHKNYFLAKTSPGIVDIAPAVFLSLAGQGDPSDKDWTILREPVK